ncbi:hypothetical protein N7475_004862 [Penicillium sp. IBT 31633x]|nr:hypothetical protein N7475_004862 [Penicillium sp. IBT 31633x]
MAPVHHGHFSFNVDTFYVTSSNGHIHPRATHSDLEAVFNTAVQDRSSSPDHLGHWYEAQILHYGLAPTKHKATAKMRLLEAIQQGSLQVPKYILKIEEDLRKEWIKQDSKRERACFSSAAIQISLDPGTLRATMAVATHCRGFNRLLDESHESVDEASMEINMQSQQQGKRTTPQTQNKKRKLNSVERTTRPVQTARRQGGTSRDSQARSNTYPSSEPYPILTSTFIENRHDPSVRDRTLQQAECQITRPLDETDSHGRDSTLHFDDMPAPANTDPADDHCSYDYVPETYLSQSFPPWPIKGRLGLINGEYDIFSDDFEAWPEEIPQGGFNLALCLDGQKIWGEYDFGMNGLRDTNQFM